MIDLRWLRDHPEAYERHLARRGLPPDERRRLLEAVLALDRRKRELETRLQAQQAERNRLSREIGRLKREGGDVAAVLARVAELKEQVKEGEAQLAELERRLEAALAELPNVLAEDVPDGPDESHNRIEREVGRRRDFAFEPKEHDVLGERLGMDFARAARIAGARFVVLWSHLARLERALAQFMLDLHVGEHGYTEVHVPYLVRPQALFGTGQLPKFAEDLFRTTDDRWLIPTAEVPLTNLVAGEILPEAKLPLRLVAATPCFRAEAGAAGRDTRGMIRQHQFDKVELVSITTPEASREEHERMTACAEEVLRRLGLSYRVVTLCSGDTGFAAMKTYDLEVWLPGQGRWREISSCSNCGDFQARRMRARYRPEGEKRPRLVHTLNGSGVAVGRALVAVLETYQEADGTVVVPEVLRPYMGGLARLEPDG